MNSILSCMFYWLEICNFDSLFGFGVNNSYIVKMLYILFISF